MRAAVVVEIDPRRCQFPNLIQTFKDIHIEYRLAIRSVKAFDVAVLRRASGLYEIEFDAVAFGPIGDGYRRKFRSVVEPDPLWQPACFCQTVKHSDDPTA